MCYSIAKNNRTADFFKILASRVIVGFLCKNYNPIVNFLWTELYCVDHRTIISFLLCFVNQLSCTAIV